MPPGGRAARTKIARVSGPAVEKPSHGHGWAWTTGAMGFRGGYTSKILPGLRMLFGSNARLIARIMSRLPGSTDSGM